MSVSNNEAMEHISTEHLLDYADERLAPQEHRRVEQHLADCAACRADLASLRQTISMLAEDDWVMPPARVRASVQRSFRQQAAEGETRPAFLEWLGALLAPRRGPALALAALLMILAAGLAYRALQTPPPEQTVAASSVSGPAEVQSAGSAQWQSLEGGAALSQGDLLRTGSGSVLLTFADGSTIQVQPESVLAVGELGSDPRTVALEQRLGETRNRILPAAAADARFEIGTPSALITTQAAEFEVMMGEGEATRVVVSSGEVSVIAEGASLALAAGQEAAVQPGEQPQLLGEEPTPTATPTATEPTPTTTSTPTATPSATPTASSTPTLAPPAPTATATMEPTEPPAPPPTEEPDDNTPEPTQEADDETPEPTEEPDKDDDTPEPTREPDEDHTPEPTEESDDDATPEPTRELDND